MKCDGYDPETGDEVAPLAGAWIEIQDSYGGPIAIISRPPRGGVD